jgi:flagellar motor protein MotB
MARRGYKAHPKAHESEDSYFISMTDILVGLLFIFIILIVFFAILVARDNQELKEQQNREQEIQIIQIALGEAEGKLEDAQKQLEATEYELKKTTEKYSELAKGAEKRELDRASVVEGVFRSLEKDGFKGMMPLAEKGILRFTGEGTFASSKYDLPEESAGNILFSAVAERLAERLACFAYRDKSDLGIFAGGFLSSAKLSEKDERLLKDGRTLVIYGEGCDQSKNAIIQNLMIEGHTDNRPMVGMDNLELSARRALSVYRLMVEKTPVLGRYYNISGEPIISFSGYGEDRPVERNDTSAGRSANRRTDIRIIMDSPEVPKIDNIFDER